MASPSVGSKRHSTSAGQEKQRTRRLPLFLRRCAAWTLEVSFVAISAAVPYELGAIANSIHSGQTAPLNPLLSTTRETVARTLAIPISDRQPSVAPITNLVWSIAVLAPVVVAGSQIYLLGVTGRTTPKRWLGLRVVTATGDPPGVVGAIVREGAGRWGIPLGLAYLIWRYSGAFPGLGILAGLSAVFVIGEAVSAQFQRQRRALHDRLAGTYVIDALRGGRRAAPVYPTQVYHPAPTTHWDDEGAIAAIVLTPDSEMGQQGLWGWMRRHPGSTLVLATTGAVGLILLTFVGTQVYIQRQANWREVREQDDRLFIALVDKLSPPVENSVEERQAAILTLGTIQDARAVPLLVDLLAQETNPQLIESLQQALVTTGPDALEPLRRLNQALTNDFASLGASPSQAARDTVMLRQRATQRAIAKILTLYSGQFADMDMGRVDLSQSADAAAPFVLVLDQTDLGGIQLRGAKLSGASLRGARFYSPGSDGRMDTFDDGIADLSGADLREVDLTDALLRNVGLNRTNLIRATLDRANLTEARLEGANLSSARMIRANLQRAGLADASLTGADLADANLSHADMQAARLGQANAVGANFQGANLRQSDWQEADISSANLRGVNLKEANFAGARLRGTDLRNAQLQNASFKDANLNTVILQGANLTNVDFAGAVFGPTAAGAEASGFIMLPPEFEPSDHLRGVNFNDALNLSSQQLDYICAQGGLHESCAGEAASDALEAPELQDAAPSATEEAP